MSLGPNGLNVEFYKFFREDLGDHLFFLLLNISSINAVMPKAWGRTSIILIHKKRVP